MPDRGLARDKVIDGLCKVADHCQRTGAGGFAETLRAIGEDIIQGRITVKED